MSARTQLAVYLREHLDPSKYAVEGTEDLPQRISKRTVVVRHRDYTPGPALAVLTAGVTVTVVTPKQDPEAAEDDLDEGLPDVLTALRGIKSLTWSKASKVIVRETYFGFDIESTIPVDVNL